MLSYWDYEYSKYLWQYINSFLNNEYGTAGLMGNLYAESGHCPFRVQGDNVYPYDRSWQHTLDIRANYSADDFVNDTTGGGGYSLAQWTYSSRKRNYYNFVGQSNIGDRVKSAEFLMHELTNGYPGLITKLQNAPSVNYASDVVLEDYERPEVYNYETRRNYSRQVYEDFTGTPPGPTPGGALPFWLMKRIRDNNFDFI